MVELTDFERRLAAGVEAFAGPRRSVDAEAIVRAVQAREASKQGGRTFRRDGPGLQWKSSGYAGLVRLVIVGTLLLALVTALVIVGAAYLRSTTPPISNKCAGHVTDADARMGWLAELPPAERAWRSGPGPAAGPAVGRGEIAGFAVQANGIFSGVVLVDSTNGATCRLVDFTHNHGDTGILSWSPVGDALLILLRDEVLLWSMSGLVRPLPPGTDVTLPLGFAWAPDGSAVAISGTSGSIDLLAADGSPGRRFTSPNASVLAWSPGGDRLAIEHGSPVSEISIISVATLQADAMRGRQGLLGWLDQDSLLLAAPEGPASHVRVPIAGGASTPYATLPNLSGGPWIFSPDFGRALVLVAPSDGNFDVTVYNLDGSAQILAPELAPWFSTSKTRTWSPDSNAVALSLYNPEETAMNGLWVLELSGGDPRRLSTERIWIWEGSWRPQTGG